MLQGAPDVAEIDAAAQAFGLYVTPSSLPPPVEVWAELIPVVRLFDAVQSQWRVGPAGRTGLDYSVLPAWVRPGNGGRRGRRMLRDLQVMEAAALAYARKKAEQEA